MDISGLKCRNKGKERKRGGGGSAAHIKKRHPITHHHTNCLGTSRQARKLIFGMQPNNNLTN